MLWCADWKQAGREAEGLVGGTYKSLGDGRVTPWGRILEGEPGMLTRDLDIFTQC